MKLFKRNIFALLAGASLLTACSDDVLNRETNREDEGEGVVIYVPSVSSDMAPASGTRAEGTINGFDAGEADIKSLTLIAYKTDDEVPVYVNLLDRDQARPVTPGTGMEAYKAYRLDIDNGDYTMYVVANVSVPSNIKESELLNATATVPGDVAAVGLPMSCTNDRLQLKYNNDADYSAVGSNRTVSISKDNPVKIKADLRFAVAKVRVTLLNDLRAKDLVNQATINGHAAASALIEGGTAPTGKGVAYEANGKYYDMPTIPSTGVLNADIESNNMTEKAATPDGLSPWAWQTIFYIPERLAQDADNDDCSALTMKVGDDTKKLYIGHIDAAKGKIVERSHFYDYVGTPEGKFYLDVQPWTIETMAGALHGPYFLHVDQTKIDVEAGEPVDIWYESNAPITVKSNQYQNQDIYTFDTTTPNHILVSLNSEIDRTEFEAIKATNDWSYFTIQAGTLVKKIDIGELTFNEFITPSTDMITIDVSERKTSGMYSSTSSSDFITVRSNIKTLTLKKIYPKTGGEWPTDTEEGAPQKSLMVVNAAGAELTTGNTINVPDNGQFNIQVRYHDLNSTRKLWKEDKDLQVVFEGTDKDGNKVEAIVNVYIRAAHDTYRIHFYASDWNHPHIYVYQCLQMPGDLDESRTGAKRNQIVGFHDNAAALEYDFTGGAAFMGWKVGEYNDPYCEGRKSKIKDPNDANKEIDTGFWIFGGNNAGGWEPGVENWEHHYYDMDFSAKHRSEIAGMCSACTGTNHDRAWPGIHMKKDTERGAGWWSFELTGVADPGKALVMFTDCPENSHEYGDWMEAKRYPKKEEPGVALFDYPTKEGFFIYENGKNNLTFFASQNPTSQETTYRYRMYWPYNSSTWKGLNVWTKRGNVTEKIWGNKNYNNWPATESIGNGTYGKFNDTYAYLEFNSVETPLSGNVQYQRIIDQPNNQYDDIQTTISFSNFTLVDGIYSYTINSVGSGQGGKPSGTPDPGPTPTNVYTVYYTAPANWTSVKCYYWNDNGNNGWPGQDMTPVGNNRWMFKIPKDKAKHVIFNNGYGGNGNQTNNLDLTTNDVQEFSGNIQGN